jgi:plasmid stabilization system protein ParE
MAARLTPQALRDRDGALTYQHSHYGQKATAEMKAAFAEVFRRIGGWSPPGAPREAFADKKYRWVNVSPYPYNVVWALGDSETDRVIVRILQSNMDLKAAMDRTQPWS